MTSRTHKIAILAGDGIGKEVVPAGLAAIEAATRNSGITIEWTNLPWGCDYYLEKGRMMDEDGFERAAKFDAIYLGAIGSPKVPDHIAVWDLLLPLRQRFQQYVNLRPMKLMPGLTSPLANRTSADIDICSTAAGRSAGGRLSMTNQPMPSSARAAGDRPAPDMPVTSTSSNLGSVVTSAPSRRRRAATLHTCSSAAVLTCAPSLSQRRCAGRRAAPYDA